MSLADEHNAQVVADLQKRQSFLTMIFNAGLVAFPLGVICASGLTYLAFTFASANLQIAALTGFILPFVGLGAALLVEQERAYITRSIARVRRADALGLRIAFKPPRDRIDFLTAFPYLTRLQIRNSGKGTNLLYGTYEGRPLAVLDYAARHRPSYELLAESEALAVATRMVALLCHNTQVVRSQTVAVFIRGFAGLPTFAVVPQTRYDGLARHLLHAGGRLFTLPEQPEFDRRFAVLQQDRDRVSRCLTPEIAAVLLEDNRTIVEIHDGKLLVAYRHTIIAPSRYEAFLQRANRIAQAFEQVGKEGL